MSKTAPSPKTDYNGWKNRATWNVALWIGNDEPTYRAAVEFMQNHPNSRRPYKAFIEWSGRTQSRTPDRFAWLIVSVILWPITRVIGPGLVLAYAFAYASRTIASSPVVDVDKVEEES